MAASSPVSYFIPESPQFTRKLREKLMEERDKRRAQLELAADWPDYKHRVGAIAGLEIAIRLCIEIEQDMRN